MILKMQEEFVPQIVYGFNIRTYGVKYDSIL